MTRASRSAFKVVLPFFLFLVISSGVGAGSQNPFPTSLAGGTLSFRLTRTKGVFLADGGAFYSITAGEEIVLQFSASELTYVGPSWEEAKLESVLYWLNDNRQTFFKPGKSLVLRRQAGLHRFSLHGQVTINAVEDQPAGEYRGSVYITISPPK